MRLTCTPNGIYINRINIRWDSVERDFLVASFGSKYFFFSPLEFVSLFNLDVIGGEEAKLALALAQPPALINLEQGQTDT